MPTITINIASPGTMLADGSIAIEGHMWFELDDGQGRASSMESFGWTALPASRQGQVERHDSDRHQAKIYSRAIRITALQYTGMIAFARAPVSFGFDAVYNMISNNSIDFTWRTLLAGGLQPDDFTVVWASLKRYPLPDHVTDAQRRHWHDVAGFVTELARQSGALLEDNWKARLLDDLYQHHRDGWDVCWSRYTKLRPAVHGNDLLLLDLDDDGLETRGVLRGAYFDHDNDDIKTVTGWVGSNDGILVLDRNQDGVIDNGTELFGRHAPRTAGNSATDGFQALADQDHNRDGIVDRHDRHWHRLRIWRDQNQDAIAQQQELFTLAQLNISGLQVNHTYHGKKLRNGNVIGLRGQYRKTDGSIGDMATVELKEAPFFRQFRQHLPADLANAHLPDAPGSGKVRDLRAACAQSPALRATLIRYAAATTAQAQQALLPELLSAWAATAGMNTSLQQRVGSRYRVRWEAPKEQQPGSNSAPANITGNSARLTKIQTILPILDAFNGQHFFEIRNGNLAAAEGITMVTGNVGQPGIISVTLSRHQLQTLEMAYRNLQESVYGILLLQTRFKPLFEMVQASAGQNGMQMRFRSLQYHFTHLLATDRDAGLAELTEFFRYATTSSAAPQWRADLMLARQLHLRYQSNDSHEVQQLQQLFSRQRNAHLLNRHEFNAVFLGTDGDDITFGYGRNDVLRGGPGNDRLFGDDGNDLLDGGSGDDELTGADGDDIYLLRRHAGHDVIDNRADWHYADSQRVPRQQGHDIVVFDDIASGAPLVIRNRGGDMLLDYGAGDSVTIRQGLQHRYHEVNAFHFADDVVMTTAQLIRSRGIEPRMLGADNDRLRLSRHDDILYAGAGDDAIAGRGGNDTLFGEHGDDVLSGGVGADVLNGGPGADILIGGGGNDLIIADGGADVIAFDRGDGADSVRLSGDGAGRVIALGGGIRYTDLLFRKSGNELIFNLGASESLTFHNWYASREHQGIDALQIVLHGDYHPASDSPLNTMRIALFDFSALVTQFDDMRRANPRLLGWALTPALSHCHLGGHDSAALGGDTVLQYGRNRDFLSPAMAANLFGGNTLNNAGNAAFGLPS